MCPQVYLFNCESMEDDFLILFDRIGKEAQEKGLTEEVLEGLLADES
jgi:hypothetical protein